jgi:cytochrome c oxidase subunit I+III
VNNNVIGLYYCGTGLLFFLLAGILALLMRWQLAFPEHQFLDANTYNQIFTMHGTVMMFLFAVPIVEAIAVFLLPAMLGARDLPFPRLSAYAFWAYFIGGIVFFCSLFFDAAPSGGWFMYPPLTSERYSPGVGADFWLLGIGFIEISAIAGAIELIVGTLRTRPPGMSLDKMPIYAWAMLVVGGMIVLGFPPVILGTALLELERAFDMPFFDPTRGGSPLLWQHLFWLFGHPEVYIIFIPAAGMVSMMIPTLCGQRMVGHNLIVMALLGTGFLSFGLWVHHMFATGIPQVSLGYFSAASMAVAIPSGIQVFAWIATMGAGKARLTVPMLFMLGFLFTFTLGGLTGVMVAVVPFDWQVHDSYFVVAHLHYVLIGGMVFPLFAGIYYWMPMISGRRMSEWLGRLAFALFFIGFQVTFLPMHLTGLRGMPRRVYTYPEGIGWDVLNLVSSAGAAMLAVAVAVMIADLVQHLWRGPKAPDDPWKAGSLEWVPQELYGVRSIPLIRTRYPLWDQPGLAHEIQIGAHFLPNAPTHRRETIVTSAVDAEPQYVMQLPGPSWLPPLAALGTALFFILLTVKLVIPAFIGGAVAIIAIILWLWQSDPGHFSPPVDVGYGYRLPVYEHGSVSHSWWAMAVLIAASAACSASLVFGYFFLWTITPVWPPAGQPLPGLGLPLLSAALLAGSFAVLQLADRSARAGGRLSLQMLVLGGVALLVAASSVDVWAVWSSGLLPNRHSYGAVVYGLVGWQGFHVVVTMIMALYTVARSVAGLITENRRVTFENTALFWRYTVGLGIVALAVEHIAPRALGP